MEKERGGLCVGGRVWDGMEEGARKKQNNE